MKTEKIEISSKTIIFSVFFILFLIFLWQIKDLVFSFFIGFIIAGALKPAVDFFEKKHLPRNLVSLIIYLFFIFIIFNLFYLIIPPLVDELTSLFKSLPIILKNIPQLSTYIDVNLFAKNIPQLTNEFLIIVKGLFSNFLFIITTLFFGFYLLVDKNFIEDVLNNFYEENQAKKIAYIINQGQKKAGFWLWGEIILMFVVGFLTYVGLLIIGTKNALALAVLAGLLEIIPTLGPIVSAIPAALIGFSQSYLLGIFNIVLYIIVQQLENNLIVPLVMKKIIGLNPIITLIALIAGGKLAGTLGVIIAIPMVLFIKTLLIEWQKR